MNIFEQLTPTYIAGVWRTNPSNNKPYMHQMFLPLTRTDQIELEYLTGHDYLPVVLEPSAYDTKMITRDHTPAKKAKIEIPFFRESMIMNERDAMQLFHLSQNSNMPGATTLIRNLVNDAVGLLESVNVNREIMFTQLITQGGFIINGRQNTSNQQQNFQWDYDPEGTWTASNVIDLDNGTPGSSLVDPTFDFVGWMTEFINTLELEGKSIGYAIIGSQTARDLMANESIRGLMLLRGYGVAPANVPNYATFTRQSVFSFLGSYFGINFMIHDKAYGLKDSLQLGGITNDAAATPTSEFYFPQRGTISFLPAGNIGEMYAAVTPEELYMGTKDRYIPTDLNFNGGENLEVQIVNGVALSGKLKTAPCQWTTWVSGSFAPSAQRLDDVYVVNYATA